MIRINVAWTLNWICNRMALSLMAQQRVKLIILNRSSFLRSLLCWLMRLKPSALTVELYNVMTLGKMLSRHISASGSRSKKRKVPPRSSATNASNGFGAKGVNNYISYLKETRENRDISEWHYAWLHNWALIWSYKKDQAI